jgi:hypothetical protein
MSKENTVVSKDSRSSDKFMHGIKALMAKNLESGRTAPIARNRAFELHVRPRKSLSHLQ